MNSDGAQAEADHEDDDDVLHETIMAIDVRDRGTIGCCYYVAGEEILYVMQDVKSSELEVVDSCWNIPRVHSCCLADKLQYS